MFSRFISFILGGLRNLILDPNLTTIISGKDNYIRRGENCSIINGNNCAIDDLQQTIIVGLTNFTGTTSDTLYCNNLDVQGDVTFNSGVNFYNVDDTQIYYNNSGLTEGNEYFTYDYNNYGLNHGIRNGSTGLGSTVLGGWYDNKGNPVSTYNTAEGYSSLAGGKECLVNGDFSFAYGYENIVNGDYSTSFGYKNEIYDYYSTSFGQENKIYKGNCFVTGIENELSGYSSTCFGFNLESKSMIEFVIGKYNYTGNTATPNSLVDNDQLFVIGNGNSTSSNNALTVYKSGYSKFTNNVELSNSTKGVDNSVIGNGNLLIGYSNELNGDKNLILGDLNDNVGFNNLIIGTDNKVTGYTTLINGIYNELNGDNSIIGGRYNSLNTTYSLIFGEYNSITENSTGEFSGAFIIGGRFNTITNI